MSSFSTDITINAAPEKVWQILAAIGDIYRWNPGVVSSHINTEQSAGLGAGRHCDLGGKNYLKEEIVTWEVGKRLTMRIIDTNLPFKTADIHFKLQPDNGATRVTVSPEYTLKFGPIGSLLDRFYVRNTYLKGMKALLRGLKEYAEDS